MHFHKKSLALRWVACLAVLASCASLVLAAIPVAHVYHNHMPNFWPYYANNNAAVISKYNALAVGAPINYTYDGDVINLKISPPAGYPYMLPSSVGTGAMPHDDIATYYSKDAKYQVYQSHPPNTSAGWPMQAAETMQSYSGGTGQVHVTYSAALANNVNNLEALNNDGGLYNNGTAWNSLFVSDFNSLKTTNGFHTMDMIHFAGHHDLGPLAGQDFLLKDMISHSATLAQPWFFGSSYQASHGFFPTELSFSERLIPVLAKLGISWSVIGNNHFSRTLTDYPFATYDATGDAADSPPNRADIRQSSSIGTWVHGTLTNNPNITIVNKYPFDSTPHYVRYVDPMSGAATQVAGIPVSQLGEWAEGYLCSVTNAEYQPYVSVTTRQQFYVLAHDGDNSSGCSGSITTWQNGTQVTGAASNGGYNLGIDEYLKAFPIPSTDVQHVQDGSWPDVTDASTDPMFYHWHLPPLIWATQMAAYNSATGQSLKQITNLKGCCTTSGATVSFEAGWHFQEIAFAKLQAALNYAKTAEQIWLDGNPTYWSPTTTLDNQVTYSGNQLNPWMIAAPTKGDPNNNYKGGANPAELAWYFMLPAMDSGFGYYGENQDDDVKPVLAFNNSLAFSQPYVNANVAQDRTGPSVWVPQRYPYNPGSVNGSKAEGWTVQWFNTHFGIYTYAYDVSGISSIKVMIRPHTATTLTATDDTYKVVYPATLSGTSGLSITTGNVGSWTAYPMTMRDMHPVMNGVSWVASDQAVMAVVPAIDTGNLYYAYFGQYRNQLLDYYIQAVDAKGNVTNTDIQQVYVGAGTYNTGGLSGYTESTSGSIQGTEPFITATANATAGVANPDFFPAPGSYATTTSVQILDVTPGAVIHYTTDGSTPTASSTVYSGAISVSSTKTLKAIAISGSLTSSFSAGVYTIGAATVPAATPTFSPPAGNYTSTQTVTISDTTANATIYYTTDGSTPTTSSTKYTAPLSVASSKTINAIATATGFSQSGTGTAAYVLTTTVPAVPTNVAATATSTTATVTWTASTGASSYKIFRAASSSGPFTTQVGTSTTASYTDTGLSSATTYYYQVAAVNTIGSSANSATASVTTKFSANFPSMGLRGTMNSWGTTPMALVANNTWQVTVTLTASTAYTYKYDASGAWTSGQNWGAGGTAGIAVVNSGTNIAYTTGTATSYTFTFNDSTLAYSISAPVTIPTAPTGVAATSSVSTQANVTWTAVSGAASYTVYRAPTSTGTFASVGTSTTTAFTDSGLTANTTYFYYVKATNTAGTSPASSTVSVTTPPIATGCQVQFTIANANTVTGQTLYVVGNQTALGNWVPASGLAMTIQGSGANVPWTGIATLPANTAVQYKYVKWNGSTAVWEANQATTSGNREYTTPATCSSVIQKNDGNF